MLTNMKNLARLALLTALAMLVQGYHPGLEDDAYYLAAIKNNLNPALFPHDADFFRVLFQATAFDKVIALSIRWTHIPLPWALFLWQVLATFLVLWGCWRIARRCFEEEYAQWAAVTMVAALLTLPASGTGLSLTDQHLHPRALATALILAAIVAVLDGRRVLAGVLLLLAFPLHLNMTPFGVSYCFFLGWNPKMWGQREAGNNLNAVAAGALLIPLGWMFEPATPTWRQAEATRSFYFLLQWHWYEWLGVVGPLILLWWFRSLALGRGSAVLGAGRGADGLLRHFPISSRADSDASPAARAFSLARAHALLTSRICFLGTAVRRIAGPLLPQAPHTALAAAVRAAERRNVLCATPVISRHRASRTARSSFRQ